MNQHMSQAKERIFSEIEMAKRYGFATVKDVQRKIPYATLAADTVTAAFTNANSLSEYEWEKKFRQFEEELRGYAKGLVNQFEEIWQSKKLVMEGDAPNKSQ